MNMCTHAISIAHDMKAGIRARPNMFANISARNYYITQFRAHLIGFADKTF